MTCLAFITRATWFHHVSDRIHIHMWRDSNSYVALMMPHVHMWHDSHSFHVWHVSIICLTKSTHKSKIDVAALAQMGHVTHVNPQSAGHCDMCRFVVDFLLLFGIQMLCAHVRGAALENRVFHWKLNSGYPKDSKVTLFVVPGKACLCIVILNCKYCSLRSLLIFTSLSLLLVISPSLTRSRFLNIAKGVCQNVQIPRVHVQSVQHQKYLQFGGGFLKLLQRQIKLNYGALMRLSAGNLFKHETKALKRTSFLISSFSRVNSFCFSLSPAQTCTQSRVSRIQSLSLMLSYLLSLSLTLSHTHSHAQALVCTCPFCQQVCPSTTISLLPLALCRWMVMDLRKCSKEARVACHWAPRLAGHSLGVLPLDLEQMPTLEPKLTVDDGPHLTTLIYRWV